MKRMLVDYYDMQVCDLLRYGFPIDLDLEDKSIFFSVPKSNPNEWRVILDLYLRWDGVNDNVSKDWYLGDKVDLVFPKIDDFIALIKAKGPGCLMYKLDLRRAYRQICICPSANNLVRFAWKKHLFFDTVLAMGLRYSVHIIMSKSDKCFCFYDVEMRFSVFKSFG